MTAARQRVEGEPKAETGAVRRRIVQIVVLAVAQAVILLVASGDIHWRAGQIYVGTYVLWLAANAALLLPGRSALIAERSKTYERLRGADRVVSTVFGLAGPALLVVAGLDHRFGWSAAPPPETQLAGVALMLAGYAVFSWAMLSNPFFSTVIRIQTERGHTVAQGGPYRFVRHPGYAGTIVSAGGLLLLFGSVWAIIPALVLAGALVARASVEDATLRGGLAGYAAYAERVPYRLLPGVW